jgi:circadian clock protein KaiC
MTSKSKERNAPVTRSAQRSGIAKAPTGIEGFDEITGGGLPRGRVSLLLGGPGAGKTVFALESLVNGARNYGEPGIFVAFEESSRQIVANAATFGWDLPGLESEGLFFLDARLSPTTVQAGSFDLTGMLAGLSDKVRQMKTKRIVFDGIDVLLTLLDDTVAERREMHRIYEWLQAENLTGVITSKAADTDRRSSERYAFLQFMCDCVAQFSHRLSERVSLRTLRVMKYRGSAFAENEFPIVISSEGIKVATFTPRSLDTEASTERVSTGVPRLDTMLGGGYYKGSGVLITGSPGTSKTTLSATAVAATCTRGERALVVTFDEGTPQYVRNLRSVGLDLQACIDAKSLTIRSVRTEASSADEHLLAIKTMIDECKPTMLVIDPVSALAKTGGQMLASHTAVRVMDFAKSHGITTIATSLVSTEDGGDVEATSLQISTIADTWIHLAYLVKGGERNRTLTIVKSRGMKHSNQVRELILSNTGISLTDVYTAGGEVLVGTARYEREMEAREAEEQRRAEIRRRHAELKLAEAEIGARIAALQRELEAHRIELSSVERDETERVQRRDAGLSGVATRRVADHDEASVRPASRKTSR